MRDDPLPASPSRRGFLRIAGLAGGSALLAACGGGAGSVSTEPLGTARDVSLLTSLRELELALVAAYGTGSRVLGGAALEAAQLIRRQEQQHADALAQVIRDLGAKPGGPRSPDEYARRFPPLDTEDDVLRFALELEETALRAYTGALPRLSRGELRGTAAAILTNEAQHLSVLLGVLGRPQVPAAFVTGRAA